jgi:aspartyl-tRNA(Asn)/glutamyl-tRNA(Gln) amidotransferase subunit B
MEMALESEIKRQIREYTQNPDTPVDEVIKQATYRWDPEKKETVIMRRKEQADDYRYFPEPDLLPIILTDSYIENIRRGLPELPLQRERRYVKEFGLSPDNSFILTSDKLIADYFEEALKVCNNPKILCNWIIVEFAGRLKDTGKNLINCGIPAKHVGTLVSLIDKGTITGRMAKAIADDMMISPGKNPEDIVAENPDYRPVNDQGEIEKLVDQVLAENQQSIIDYKAGREKAFAFLVGQIMKMTKGKASPQIVNDLLKSKINNY